MPKQTFFNLSEDKRRKIERAAMEEFAEYGFDKSNMNRIVAESKIAKGSFYQYFANKKDLYLHLMDTVVTAKMEALESVLSRCEAHSLSYNFEELARLGLEFADSDPKIYRLGQDFTVKKPEFLEEFMEKYAPVAVDVYGNLLNVARKREELRDDLDLALAGAFINTLFNQTNVGLINQPKEKRDYVVGQLIRFIERAVLKDGAKNAENENTDERRKREHDERRKRKRR